MEDEESRRAFVEDSFCVGAGPRWMTMRFTSHPDLLAASLIDSDETADDLPGPGRNLGRVYGALGGRLSAFLSKKLSRIKRHSLRTDDNTAQIPNPHNLDEDQVSHGTNSTASNLPGPGRNVGLLFGWFGRKLERRFNNLAVLKNKGPMAIAEKILRIRCLHDQPSFILALHILEKREDISMDEISRRKMLKYCQKLLVYARSPIQSTQLQALDCIIALAICDSYTQSVLNECLEHETFLEHYSYYDSLNADSDILLSKSRKAIVSITEGHIIYLVNRFSCGGAWIGDRPFVLQEFIPQMTRYLRDPDFFFLAIRLLDFYFQNRIALEHAEAILAVIPKFTARNSEFVEWKTLDKCLRAALNGSDDNEHMSGLDALTSCVEMDGFVMDQGALEIISDLGSTLFDNNHKLPAVLHWVTKNAQLQVLIRYFEPPPNLASFGFNLNDASRIAYIVCALLRAYTSSDNLLDHLEVIEDSSASSLMPIVNAHMGNTPLTCKAATAFCYALHYGVVVRWLSIFCEDSTAGASLATTLLVRRAPIERFANGPMLSACSALISMLDCDDETIRARAGSYLHYLSSIDRFCSFAVSLALTIAKKGGSSMKLLPGGQLKLFTVAAMARFTLFRIHRSRTEDETGKSVDRAFEFHITFRSLRKALYSNSPRSRPQQGLKYHEFTCTDGAVLWLKHSSGAPFVAAGYHPIVAGINPVTRQKEYIAGVVRILSSDVFLSTIVDGASFVRYIDSDGHDAVSSEFYVLALRYEPEYLATRFPPIPSDIPEEDRTGPFYWKEVTMDPKPIQVHRRVASTQGSRKSKKGKGRAGVEF